MARRTPDKRTGKARQGTHPKAPPPSIHVRGGERLNSGSITVYHPITSGQAAQKIIREAARNRNRVEIVVTLNDGRRVELLANPPRKGPRGPGSVGMSARYLVSRREKSGVPNPNWIGTTAASLKGRLAGLAAVSSNGNRYDRGPRAQFGVDDIKSLQVNVFSRT